MWDRDERLAPTLLVAMPQLQDPNFGKTVVLLCEHREEGAMGLVINRCTDTTASSIVQLEPPIDRDNGMPVWIGGPVDPSRGWLLLSSDSATASRSAPASVPLRLARPAAPRAGERRSAPSAAASWSATPAGARASSTPSSPRPPGSPCPVDRS